MNSKTSFKKAHFFYGLIVLLLLGVLSFLSRNAILHYAFARIQNKVLREHSCQLTLKKLTWAGFGRVDIRDLCLKPIGCDTLLTVNQIALNISLIDLLTGKIGINKIHIQNAAMHIYNMPDRDNFSHLLNQRDKKSKTVEKSIINYRESANRIQRNLVALFENNFTAENTSISYHDSIHSEHIYIPVITVSSTRFSTTIIDPQKSDTLQITGRTIKKNEAWRFEINHAGDLANSIPLLPFLDGLKSNFSSLAISLSFDETDPVTTQFELDLATTKFWINHWRLSGKPVRIDKALLHAKFSAKDASITLDSSSQFQLNDIKANLFTQKNQKPDPSYFVQVNMPETKADIFFRSLPNGMFSTLQGIECEGVLSYNLLFSLNSLQPDSLVFDSKLSRKDFRIIKFGEEDFTRINQDFTYDAFDKEHFIRSIYVGQSNPIFTPLDRIHPYLINSVLQSEDPSFMNHRGFLPEAFRESIVQNYKEKRFARGGSTISMQLVKNVFLNHQKTISRKAEEALIVYLIENLNLVSKERMLEIYLNVIEWGPNVYGIGEASRFYFNKTPGQLNLSESIFLASIIPSPKYFKYRFNKDGTLREFMQKYYEVLTRRMLSKGRINPSDTIGIFSKIQLKGPAAKMISPDDTIAHQEDFIPIVEE